MKSLKSVQHPGAPPGKEKPGNPENRSRAETQDAGNVSHNYSTTAARWRIPHLRARLIRLHTGPAKVRAVRLWSEATRNALRVTP